MLGAPDAWRARAQNADPSDSDVIVGVSQAPGTDTQQQLKRIAFQEPPVRHAGGAPKTGGLRYSRLLHRASQSSDQGSQNSTGAAAPDAPPKASYSSTAAPTKPALKSSSYTDLMPLAVASPGDDLYSDDFPRLQPSPNSRSSGPQPPLLPPPPMPAAASRGETNSSGFSSSWVGAGARSNGVAGVGASSLAAESPVDLAERWRMQKAQQELRQQQLQQQQQLEQQQQKQQQKQQQQQEPKQPQGEVAGFTLPPGTISLDKDDPLGAAAAALAATLARRNGENGFAAKVYASEPLVQPLGHHEADEEAPAASPAPPVLLPSLGDGGDSVAGGSPKGGGTSMVFEGIDDAASQLPSLRRQLTPRALLAGVLVGGGLALLCMRLALVVGAAPSFQVLSAVGCLLLLRAVIHVLGRDISALSKPLIAQEAAVAAATALACAGSVAAAGFASVLMALDPSSYTNAGAGWPGNSTADSYSQLYWRNALYMLLVTVGGGVLMLALRKPLMGRRRAVYPTGEATGSLLGALLPGEATTPAAAYQRQRVNERLGRWTVASFAFSLWQWFFNRPGCNGFRGFPTFGVQALRYTWNFDFQLPFVGVGLMVPVATAWSLLLGGVVAWGVLMPLLARKEGQWYPAGLPDWDFRGLDGYRLVMATTLLLVDAAYLVAKFAFLAVKQRVSSSRAERAAAAGRALAAGGLAAGSPRPRSDGFGSVPSPTAAGFGSPMGEKWPVEGSAAAPVGVMGRVDAMLKGQLQPLRRKGDVASDDNAGGYLLMVASMDRVLRRHVFMADRTPWWLGLVGYAVALAACTAVLPVLYARASWYMVLVACFAAAVAGVANAKGTGETDVNLSYVAYGWVASLLFAAWSGRAAGGLVAGGVVGAVAYGSAQVMYAFRAGHAVLASPLAIFLAQLLGALVGCLIAPAALLMYAQQGPLGSPQFPAPEAVVWRQSASLAANGGLGQLPDYTWAFALGAGALSLALCVIRDVVPARLRPLLPVPSTMGVTFVSGANIAIDVCVGALARVVWALRHPGSAQVHAGVVGAGLIVGDGLWLLGRALLAAFGVLAPICMVFTQ